MFPEYKPFGDNAVAGNQAEPLIQEIHPAIPPHQEGSLSGRILENLFRRILSLIS